MGRKRGENSTKNYFDKPEEQASIDYLNGDSATRDKIYREKLFKPFYKMVESQIKRYRLMRDDISIEDLIYETLSHIISKFDRFDPTAGYKAYSFFGTISVNYLKGQAIKQNKVRNIHLSYEDISSDLEQDTRHSYEMTLEKKVEAYEFINILIGRLEEEIKNEKMKPNDIKVGKAILEILKNWETFIINEETNTDSEEDEEVEEKNKYSNIFSKSKILYYIRESTFLEGKDVRNSLKKFKTFYRLLKGEYFT